MDYFDKVLPDRWRYIQYYVYQIKHDEDFEINFLKEAKKLKIKLENLVNNSKDNNTKRIHAERLLGSIEVSKTVNFLYSYVKGSAKCHLPNIYYYH